MRLTVHMNERQVGWLSYDSLAHQFELIYDVDWVASDDGFPLAPSLPLVRTDQTREAHSLAVKIFFENLLPEGRALEDAALLYEVSKNNVAGLLAMLGRETAGAMRLELERTNEPSERAMPVLRHLPRAELSRRVRDRASTPFAVWDQKIWLAIAGYQDKLAIYQDTHGEWFLAETALLASTHILKPEPTNPRMAELTSNEFFCMRLAKAVGLNAANVQLHHLPEPVLLITRFDRIVSEGNVHRLPVIDGCQALGLPVSCKYERPFAHHHGVGDIRSGASLASLFHLLNASARPAAEKISLLRWVVFQVLIGNIDAHAKNLTFFCGSSGLSLAPAYDLVSGRMYVNDQIEDTFAMAIGDAFRVEELSAEEWVKFSCATKLSPRLVTRELTTLSSKTTNVLERVTGEVCAEGANGAVVAQIGVQVRAACEKLHEMARSISYCTGIH